MIHRALLALAPAIAMALLVPSPAAAHDYRHDVAARDLTAAQELLLSGEYARAASTAGPYVTQGWPDPTRAEANRIYGLALFQLGLRTEAEKALLAYMKLDPDAHLDPALVPPEALVFFEDVRARHQGELLRYKPRPPRKRYWLLNLVPPLGQWQNGQTTKAWIFGLGELVLLGTNIATYIALSSMCDETDFTCTSDSAGALKTINLVSGVAFIGLYAYGVYDGFRGYSRPRVDERPIVTLAPTGDGVVFVLGGSFD